ncbi:unnamed protein product [Phaedon cochleariae]|uniref:Uncharacterized protein n=1 Tax=Phaedon cochleariae TaxID=80249 RepID=A0A9N9SE44_PHACE|nr:unnamed protein product [Phaedon cochleariae]
MPTWFMHKSIFKKVGGFVESDKGTPEDLIFFNKHLDLGGKICRVEDFLLVYSFHADQTTFSIHKNTIFTVRIERLQRVVLNDWPHFTIWNAGKQGRKLYKSLSEENRMKVGAFCDVDRNKIGHKYVPFDAEKRTNGTGIDIVHFRDARPPFVICVKMDTTGGDFENHLRGLHLKEGTDYVMFS